jgi:hypothetical protein
MEREMNRESRGPSNIEIAGGTIVFLKNATSLYRDSYIDRGTAERVFYRVGEIQLTGK